MSSVKIEAVGVVVRLPGPRQHRTFEAYEIATSACGLLAMTRLKFEKGNTGQNPGLIISMVNPKIREIEGGVVFTAKVVPGSSRTAFCGLLDGMIKVKVAAAPEKGKANRCLIAFLSKQLGVKKNAVTIVSGPGSPVKQVRVAGVTSEVLIRELGLDGLARE